MKPIDSENVIAWLNAQIEKVRGGWSHDYGFPTNVIVALTDVKRFVKNLPTIEPEVRHGKGCSYCKGRSYTKKPLTVITRTMKRVEVCFNFCPNCGRDMRATDTREASLKLCSDTHNPYHRIVREFLLTAPTVDAEPVRHGRWIPIEYDRYADGAPVWDKWECSECGHEHSGEEDTLTAFCPDCGAKMDGKDINVITKDGGADNG